MIKQGFDVIGQHFVKLNNISLEEIKEEDHLYL